MITGILQINISLCRKNGYTKMFESMLNNTNIEVLLNTDYKKIIDI